MNFRIGDIDVGVGQPIFIVAEISCNHKGQLRYAKKLIEEAKEAGADAVKFQSYTAPEMTIECDKEWFKLKGNTPWEGRYLRDLYQQASTDLTWFTSLKRTAEENEILMFSSVFSVSGVEWMEKEIDPPAYKLASFEIQYTQLIEAMGKTWKPIIMSIGIASLDDIFRARDVCYKERNPQIAFLKCSSTYPTSVSESNLQDIKSLQHKYNSLGALVGLSDHTKGITTAIASTALGATIIEKHIKLEGDNSSLDAEFSLAPSEFKEMVEAIRETESAMGGGMLELTEGQEKAKLLGRSIFIVADMKEGDFFSKSNIAIIRPGYGMEPRYYDNVLGKQAQRNIERGTPLKGSMIR